jgi:hypothetical protein
MVCTSRTAVSREPCYYKIQGYSKRSIHFQKCILQKLLMLNPCPVYGWKGNSQSSDIDDLK